MADDLIKELRLCPDLRSILDCVLRRGMTVTGAPLANIQLLDSKAHSLQIAAQSGFKDEFLKFFRRVDRDDKSACSMALKRRSAVFVEDVEHDRAYSPQSRSVMRDAGVRAVQSVPLVSTSGALWGMLSTHFPHVHRPSCRELDLLSSIARMAADAISAHHGRSQSKLWDAYNVCLAGLSSAALELLKPHLSRLTMEQQSVLWAAGEPAAHFFFPISGLVSITVPMRDGGSIEVCNIGREAAACGSFEPSEPRATSNGFVSVRGTFNKIAREHLFAAAEHSDEVSRMIVRCRDWALTQAQQMAACNALHSAEQRFARWLLLCSQKLDAATITITQEQIALILGLRRTTVTFVAQSLHAQGLIDYRRGKITILNPAELQAVACECCERLGPQSWSSTSRAH